MDTGQLRVALERILRCGNHSKHRMYILACDELPTVSLSDLPFYAIVNTDTLANGTRFYSIFFIPFYGLHLYAHEQRDGTGRCSIDAAKNLHCIGSILLGAMFGIMDHISPISSTV